MKIKIVFFILLACAVFYELTQVELGFTEPQDCPPTRGGVKSPGCQDPATTTVTGEVTKIEGDYFIIKDVAGKEVRLHIDRDILRDIAPGDKITATVSRDGETNTITKLKEQTKMKSDTRGSDDFKTLDKTLGLDKTQTLGRP